MAKKVIEIQMGNEKVQLSRDYQIVCGQPLGFVVMVGVVAVTNLSKIDVVGYLVGVAPNVFQIGLRSLGEDEIVVSVIAGRVVEIALIRK